MRNLSLSVIMLIGVLLLQGCGNEPSSSSSSEKVKLSEVNVYSHRHYDSDKKLFEIFKQKTGIQVNVVKAKADQLIERLAAEGEHSPADVLLTVDVGRLYKAKKMGLLQPVESEALHQNIPQHLRDEENHWYGLTKRARVIVYREGKVDPKELSTYEDLADPKWKGRLLTRSSTNIYNQSLIASMIAAHGVEKTEKWVEGIVANFARDPKGNDRGQMRAVAAGEGDLAIVNTYYLGKLINGDEADQEVSKKIRIFFPNQEGRGTHVNISGAGVVKSSKNVENAIRLLEFLSDVEAQSTFAEVNYEYPVNPKVKASKLVQSWGEFKEDEKNLSLLATHGQEALKVADRAGWK